MRTSEQYFNASVKRTCSLTLVVNSLWVAASQEKGIRSLELTTTLQPHNLNLFAILAREIL